MRTRRTRFASIAVVITLGAAALAVAAVGRAGSGPKEFNFFAQPTILSQGSNGVAWGSFKPVSGGSATHVVISVTIPAGFVYVPGISSPGCGSTAVAGTFDCPVGTVNLGQTVKRYVGFRAPDNLAPGPYDVSGKVRFDNGSPGAGGGGVDELPGGPVSITVVTAPDGNNDGGCGNGRPSTTNVPLSSTNLVSTEITSGTRLASLGLLCTWAFVGETDGPRGTSKTPVSFFNFPPTEPGQPVQIVVSIYDMPVPFKDLKVLFDPEFTGSSGVPFDQKDPLATCTGPKNELGLATLGSGQSACLQNLVKAGKGAQATILAIGTGADPGSGFG
jgi:hypothetical protein